METVGPLNSVQQMPPQAAMSASMNGRRAYQRGLSKQMMKLNKYSASGSEVLSAALHDNGRATIIGETTFGKGTVNRSEKLGDDRGALFVTVARWLTPKRVGIDKTGITPDIEVSLSDADIAAKRDSQLFSAIDYLRGTQ